MKKWSHLLATSVVAGLFGSAGPGLAEPLQQAAPPAGQETILVVAPRDVRPKGMRTPYTGAPVVTTTVTVPVLYGDLDLTTDGGVARLLSRVDHVSRDACRQLDRLVRFSRDPGCVGRARANGEAEARVVIARARPNAPIR